MERHVRFDLIFWFAGGRQNHRGPRAGAGNQRRLHSVDSIEVALKNSSLHIHPAEDAGYLAAVAVAKDNLVHGLNVVADTVNPVELTRRWWAEAARACNARLLNVEIVCSDRAEHKRRVEMRRSDIVGLDLPDWKRVQSRDYEDWTGNRVALDTSKLPVNDCVKRIIEALPHAA
jgi:predicted kinase